jgi:single-stranded-DNA-specific exonuclease
LFLPSSYNSDIIAIWGGQVSSAERWYLRRKASAAFQALAAGLNVPPLLAQVLYARHIDTPERVRAFLASEGDLGDPFLMADMRPAVERLCQALRAGEAIVVYGDFDADGVSATVLLVSALKALGGQVTAYIPDRFSEAYGINMPALDRLHSQGAQLVVSVDCGVRSFEEVAHARALGLDVIITDHHSLLDKLPPALAVLDPKRADCTYPFKDLAGVGVAHRLVEALASALGATLDGTQFEDLVALGTVADVAPLLGENRILVQRGLRHMRAAPRPGLRALMQAAGIRPAEVDSHAIAFRLGPRLNAAGRLKSAMLAYDLLATPSEDEAQRLAATLDEINQERQHLLEEQVCVARELLGTLDGRSLLFVEGPHFHDGIVGLVASRLADEFYRPALVMRRGEKATRGSARSIEGFHITQALDSCVDLLVRHGGHARAAGFVLLNENLPVLRERLEHYGAEHLDVEMLQRRHSVDALVPLSAITGNAPAALAALEPVGEGNPEPRLATVGLQLVGLRSVGADSRHLRLEVTDGARTLPAIAFRQGHQASAFAPGDRVDLIYCPTLNEWQGVTSLQLVVEAVRKSATPEP